MVSDRTAEVLKLRLMAARLRDEAAALEQKADSLEDVGVDPNAAADEGLMETLDHVWVSDAAKEYVAALEEQERRINESKYDVKVVRGCRIVRTALLKLKAEYGDTLDVRDAAVVLLDAGVCSSREPSRSAQVQRVRIRINEFLRKSADWERSGENVAHFVGADVAV